MNIKRLAGWIVVCAIFIVFALVLLGFFGAEPQMKLPHSSYYDDMKLIRKALFLYENEKGQFPLDARGTAYALYKLKPYFSELPRIMSSNIWNEEAQKLDVVPLQYRNGISFSPDGTNRANELDWVVRIIVEEQGYICLARDGVISFSESRPPDIGASHSAERGHQSFE